MKEIIKENEKYKCECYGAVMKTESDGLCRHFLYSLAEIRELLGDEIYESFIILIGNISMLRKFGYSADSEKVQKIILDIQWLLSPVISGSLMALNMFVSVFEQGALPASELDQFTGAAISDYFCEAFQIFYEENIRGSADDMILLNSVSNIFLLAANNFTADSEEVRGEAERILGFISEMKFIPKDMYLQIIMDMGILLKSELTGEQSGKTDIDGFLDFLAESVMNLIQ